MPIIEPTQTAEEIAAGNKAGEATRQKLASKIMDDKVFQSLEIPTGEEEQEAESQEEEEQSEESQEEESSEETSEEEEQVEEEETAEDTEDEEMVPKSKVQKRIDRLTAENRALKAQQESKAIDKATEKQEQLTERQVKLRKMTLDELNTLKDEVDDAKFAARTAKDDAKVRELKALDREIDETIRTAPARFEAAQINAFNKKANELAARGEIKNVEVAGPKIIEEARKIYLRFPKLAQEVDGQAIALELAYDQYRALSKYSLTKGSVQNLKSQVNKLKQKTSLDNRSSKSTGDSTVIDNLRKNASNGTTKDKVALIKNDPRFNVDAMIPAEYK